MRRVFAIAIVFAALLAPVSLRAASGHFDRLERGALPQVRPPKVRTVVLPNGMRCYLLADHTLPIVEMGVIVKAGSIYEPAKKVGLAALSASLMKIGGAGERSPEEFDSALDDLGASLSVSSGREMQSANLKVMSEDVRRGLGLFFDMLFKPVFDKSRLKTARKTLQEEIIREDDDPGEQASYELRKLVYGEDSPWARRPTKRSIRAVKLGDIESYHERYYRANNMILIAAGDFSYAEFISLLKEFTACAPVGEIDFPKVEPVEMELKGDERTIVRPTSQAFIRMGELTIKRHNPDKYALFLVDTILGAGGFKSRLMDEIRVKRGLAYSVYSALMPGTDYGLFVVGLDTSANQADRAIELVREQIAAMAGGHISKEELAFAKRSMISRLVFLFDKPYGVVSHMARFHFYGYPEDYWRIYRDRIVASKLSDLKRVAKQYLHPDKLDVVIVGPNPKGRARGKGR